ncbi:MAG TPA: oxygen-independent coproporphyrinogen III oxidase [Clostridia bacterium]|jgi:oxygen-independent coproporphyrinogen-3 oxidase|nr:oxygen-independent coproporphyrinogen III oxidase [Clostridia bacterium]
MEEKLGLYIHIPFCVSKCNYCDFNSYPLEQNKVEKYLAALQLEMASYREILEYNMKKIDTVYIGGGTPTCLAGKHLAYLFDYCLSLLPRKPGGEFSLEANPGTLDRAKIKLLKKAGVNRISMGLQAWQDRLLKGLGRIHDLDEFIDSYFLLKEEGFTNINVDLMFGLPGQTMDDWAESLTKLVELNPQHISVYSLKLEEGTELFNLFQQGKVGLPSEDVEIEMYDYALDFLTEKGYKQYEISNFSLPGYECQHNLIYWEHQQYLGLGAGAHSYFNGYRYSNYNSINDYIFHLERGRLPIETKEAINLQRRIEDTIILGLRLNKGIDLKELAEETGEDLILLYDEKLERLKKRGLIQFNGKNLSLTRKGLLLSNQVFLEFIC